MLKNILVLIMIFVLTVSSYFKNLDNNLRIVFFDVGQGDGILIITPDRKKIIVDGGPNEDILESIPKYMFLSDRNIDFVIATHGDADHITGLVELTKNYNINEFIYNGKNKNTILYQELIKNLKDRDVNLIEAFRLDEVSIGCCVVLEFVWPKDLKDALSDNDASVSFVLKYGFFEGFFGGDLAKEYEDQISSKINYDMELIKIGHHGSNTSTSMNFIQNIRPELAIISVGKYNKHGHPNREVLNILKDQNVEVRRTDIEGTIEIVSNSKEYWVKSKM